MSNDDNKGDDRGNANTSLTVEGQSPAMRSDKKTSHEVQRLQNRLERYKRRLERVDRWEFRFSLVIATAAVVSAVVGVSQWYFMGIQLDEMRDNGKQADKLIGLIAEQSKAAVEQAKAANDSLAESRRHFQADQRPYVISNITPLAPKVGASLEVRVSMINYGKTPALKVGTYSAVLIGPDALKQADRWFADERQQKFDAAIGSLIPPGIPVGLSREIPISSIKKLTSEDMETLIDKDNQAVFVARHLYFDSAGNSFGTDSCYRLLKGWLTAFCEQHNEIHEDYKDRSSGGPQVYRPISSQ